MQSGISSDRQSWGCNASRRRTRENSRGLPPGFARRGLQTVSAAPALRLLPVRSDDRADAVLAESNQKGCQFSERRFVAASRRVRPASWECSAILFTLCFRKVFVFGGG